jgi:HD-GYP domain-containing protein (c-di-GMP phosphodiesterase class II)
VGGASLELLYPASGEIVTELACGKWAPVTGMRTPANVGISSRVLSTCQPYISTDVVGDGLVARPDLVDGLTSVAIAPVSAQHQPIGALWVGRELMAPFTKEEVNLLIALGEMIGNTIHRMKLHEQTEQQAEEIMLAYDHTLEGWAKALELRDKETEGHSRRVTDLTLQLARKFGIPASDLIHIRRGVLLHDIGKLGIPDQMLKKPAPLNAAEWDEMKKHPQYAYDMIYPINYLRPTLELIYNHHEHWDGSGYPRGLSGEQIPLTARIFTVVDVYDALSSDRSYRSAWEKSKVLAYLQEQSGKLFDPRIVAAFLELASLPQPEMLQP